jgi:hypothetical protein
MGQEIFASGFFEFVVVALATEAINHLLKTCFAYIGVRSPRFILDVYLFTSGFFEMGL